MIVQQGYLPLQEQITSPSEQDLSSQEGHTPQEGYESMNIIIFFCKSRVIHYSQADAPPPSYPSVQQQPLLPNTQTVPETVQQQTVSDNLSKKTKSFFLVKYICCTVTTNSIGCKICGSS